MTCRWKNLIWLPARIASIIKGVDTMGLFSFIGKTTLSVICLATPGAQMAVLPLWLGSGESNDGSDIGEWITSFVLLRENPATASVRAGSDGDQMSRPVRPDVSEKRWEYGSFKINIRIAIQSLCGALCTGCYLLSTSCYSSICKLDDWSRNSWRWWWLIRQSLWHRGKRSNCCSQVATPQRPVAVQELKKGVCKRGTWMTFVWVQYPQLITTGG